jgi:mannosyl-oligosaccharide alpha-1,2-mannosidase
MALAELGSFSVEFTRLTQITGDPKYFDAVQRISDELERSQNVTRIPGLWPVWVNADRLQFDAGDFSLGGCADSAYEYLPKEHILLGAQTDQYRDMYTKAIEAIKENLLFRTMTKDESQKILFTADVRASKGGALQNIQYVQDHLKCFLGGMVGIGAKVFDREEDMDIARGLTDGCIWAYDQMPSGIMPEIMKVSACEDIDDCPWDERRWYNEVMASTISTPEQRAKAKEVIEYEGIPPGVLSLRDPTYKLRLVFFRYTQSLTNSDADPKQSNPFSSCIESRATSPFRTLHGVCSRILTRRRAPSTATLLSRTSVLPCLNTAIRWKASGWLRR